MSDFDDLIQNYVDSYIQSDTFLKDIESAYTQQMKKQPSKRLRKNIEAKRVGKEIEVYSYSKPERSLLKNYPYWQIPEYAWAMWNEEGRIFDLAQWNRDGQPDRGKYPKPDKYYSRLSKKGFDADSFYNTLDDDIADGTVVYGIDTLANIILKDIL